MHRQNADTCSFKEHPEVYLRLDNLPNYSDSDYDPLSDEYKHTSKQISIEVASVSKGRWFVGVWGVTNATCGYTLTASKTFNDDSDDDDHYSKVLGAVLGSVFGFLFLVFLIVAVLFLVQRKKFGSFKRPPAYYLVKPEARNNHLKEPFLTGDAASDNL